MKTFEEYLRQVHDKEYKGTADDAPDDFEDWECNLGCGEFIELAQEYKKIVNKQLDMEIDELAHDHDWGDLNI